MDRIRMLLSRLTGLLRSRPMDEHLDEEMQTHLELAIAENRGRGMAEDEARTAALRSFGGVTQTKERYRMQQSLPLLEDVWRDMRYAMRTLRLTPGFTIAAVLVMALGLGANTAMFTVIRGVLLKPLPFRDAGRLYNVYSRTPNGNVGYYSVAGGDFTDWQQKARGFEEMASYSENHIDLAEKGGSLPEVVGSAVCSGNFFSLLGVQPAYGRLFIPADDRLQAPATVVLNWSLFQRRFRGNPGVVGRTVMVDSKPVTVIGVLPQWYQFPDAQAAVWLPEWTTVPESTMQAHGYSHMFYVVARLRPGWTMEQASDELNSLQRKIHDSLPGQAVAIGTEVRPVVDGLTHEVRRPLLMLMGAVVCVLLIVCLNVANLLVARSAARRREMAIRTALGGTRWRLLREQMMESVLLCGMGGALGSLLAWGGVHWLTASRDALPRVGSIQLDWPVLLFAMGASLLCGMLAGVLPGLGAGDARALDALRDGSRGVGGSRSGARLRRAMLAAEVALTVVLLIGAGLLLKGFAHLRGRDVGCVTDNVLTMRYSLPDAKYAKREQVAGFHETLLERVKALPGVKAAALITDVPGAGSSGNLHYTIVEHPPLPPGHFNYVFFRAADAGYFQAMQIPILRGRTFTADERLEHDKFLIVSEAFVREQFPNEDPLGKHVHSRWGGDENDPGQDYEIVGVAADTRSLLSEEPEPMIYFPIAGGITDYATLAVRTDRDASALALPIQRIIAQMDPELPVANVMTMDELLGKSMLDVRFDAELVAGFAVLSIVLAAMGLYAVLSYLVAQRTNELGIRMALGAQRGEVLWRVLVDGMRPAWLGLLLGLGVAALSARVIREMLYGVQPLDWSVFVGVAALLTLIAGLACLMPAWRASRLEPSQVLRAQ